MSEIVSVVVNVVVETSVKEPVFYDSWSAPGNHINSVATAMCVKSKEIQGPVYSTFNEIRIDATPTSIPEEVVKWYMDECDRRAKTYWDSPEGKAAAQESRNRVDNAQKIIDDAMVDLATLDFTNNSDVIYWFERIRDATDHIGVVTPADEIINVFEAHAFKANENTGKDFIANDEDNVARYLVGQALECLSATSWGPRAIHQIFDKFADDWREKFNHPRLLAPRV